MDNGQPGRSARAGPRGTPRLFSLIVKMFLLRHCRYNPQTFGNSAMTDPGEGSPGSQDAALTTGGSFGAVGPRAVPKNLG